MVKPLQSIGVVYLLGITAVLSVTFLPKFINNFIIYTGNTELSYLQINAVQFSIIALLLMLVIGGIIGGIIND